MPHDFTILLVSVILSLSHTPLVEIASKIKQFFLVSNRLGFA